MITTTIGIDPGRTGAIARISEGEVDVWDMPVRREGERGIDVGSFDAILSLTLSPKDAVVGLEWNGGRPGEVPDFAYRFGLQTGQIDGLLFGRGYRVEHLSANKWTGKLGLPGKTHSGAVEQRAAMIDLLYPQASPLIRGPRGGLLDGRIDAILIADYMRRGHCTRTGHKGGRRPPVWRGPADLTRAL